MVQRCCSTAEETFQKLKHFEKSNDNHLYHSILNQKNNSKKKFLSGYPSVNNCTHICFEKNNTFTVTSETIVAKNVVVICG